MWHCYRANKNVKDLEGSSRGIDGGYIAGFGWQNRFVKSNIFRTRFKRAPAEYCISVTPVLRNLPLRVPLLRELTYCTTWRHKSRDAAHNSRLVQCPNLNHASSWAI
jgi:hypothetical protein